MLQNINYIAWKWPNNRRYIPFDGCVIFAPSWHFGLIRILYIPFVHFSLFFPFGKIYIDSDAANTRNSLVYSRQYFFFVCFNESHQFSDKIENSQFSFHVSLHFIDTQFDFKTRFLHQISFNQFSEKKKMRHREWEMSANFINDSFIILLNSL